MRRLLPIVALIGLATAAYFLWSARDRANATAEATKSQPAKSSVAGAGQSDSRTASVSTGPQQSASAPPVAPIAGSSGSLSEADFPIAASLNAPSATIAQDLDVMRQVFEAWLSNFPREGNPVGENAEITAALMGENRLGLALIPRGHRAVNDRGELCDRWGTPFRFHQLSGTKMEVRSAGPDRKFGTDDDAMLTPE